MDNRECAEQIIKENSHWSCPSTQPYVCLPYKSCFGIYSFCSNISSAVQPCIDYAIRTNDTHRFEMCRDVITQRRNASQFIKDESCNLPAACFGEFGHKFKMCEKSGPQSPTGDDLSWAWTNWSTFLFVLFVIVAIILIAAVIKVFYLERKIKNMKMETETERESEHDTNFNHGRELNSNLTRRTIMDDVQNPAYTETNEFEGNTSDRDPLLDTAETNNLPLANTVPPNVSPANTVPPNGSPANSVPLNGSPANTAPTNGSPANTVIPNGSPANTVPLNGSPANSATPNIFFPNTAQSNEPSDGSIASSESQQSGGSRTTATISDDYSENEQHPAATEIQHQTVVKRPFTEQSNNDHTSGDTSVSNSNLE